MARPRKSDAVRRRMPKPPREGDRKAYKEPESRKAEAEKRLALPRFGSFEAET